MKQGSTFILLVSLDVDIRYMDSIIFTIKNGNKVLTKTDYLYDAEKKQFQLFLTQEDTIEMQGRCLIEAQINFTDLHVAKSEIGTFIMNPTLATKIMTGNQATTDGEEVALEVDGEIVYIGGSGGTSDYMHLENKPQINGVELIGNKSAKELGIEVPKKTSDLDNDSGFITKKDLPSVPTKTSQLTNDSGYITKDDLPNIEIPDVDLSGYATKEYVDNYSVVLSHDGNGNATIEGLVVLVDGNEVEY